MDNLSEQEFIVHRMRPTYTDGLLLNEIAALQDKANDYDKLRYLSERLLCDLQGRCDVCRYLEIQRDGKRAKRCCNANGTLHREKQPCPFWKYREVGNANG